MDSIKENEVKNILYGQGKTEGIVGIDAKPWGQVTIWTRQNGILTRQDRSFTPWAVVSNKRLLVDLKGAESVTLQGNLPFDTLLNINNYTIFKASIIETHNKIAKEKINSLWDLRKFGLHWLSPEEQFLIRKGETFYKGMTFGDVLRMQIDLETTGLDPSTCEIFQINVRVSNQMECVITGENERVIINNLINLIRKVDPDIIENHNLFEFDLKFLIERCRLLHIPLALGRSGEQPTVNEGSLKVGGNTKPFTNVRIVGRDLIDTLHSTERFDALTGKLGDIHGLKHVAKTLGVERENGAYIEGDQIYETYKTNPHLVAEYGLGDVREVDAISTILNADKFQLAQMIPMPLQRIAVSGSAQPLELILIRHYLSNRHSLPSPCAKVSKFQGATIKLLRKGIFKNVGKIDVSSMYPSIMITKHLGPAHDPLGAFQVTIKTLMDLRLKLKARAKAGDRAAGPTEKAYKIVINSAFGYLGYPYGLFNNPAAAEEVTKNGRDILDLMEKEMTELGAIPIEADTDGIIAQLPKELELKYLADKINVKLSQSHPGIRVEPEDNEPWSSAYVYKKKNYAIKSHNDIKITGGAFKGSDKQPIIRETINACLEYLLAENIPALREKFQNTYERIRDGKCGINEIKKTVKLGKSVSEYKKAIPVQAKVLQQIGKIDYPKGTRVEFYKAKEGYKHSSEFKNDYDEDYYLKILLKAMMLFREAFTSEEMDAILDLSKPLANVQPGNFDVKPEVEKLFIELSSNFKTNKQNKNRHNFVPVSDTKNIVEFCENHNFTDVYWSAYAFLVTGEPTAAKTRHLQHLKMLGDFVIEAEGGFLDPAPGNPGPEKMKKAAETILSVKEILNTQFKIPNKHIQIRFNGGKSLYIVVPYKFFVDEPTLRLDAKYTELMKFVRNQLKTDQKVDESIYDITQVLRIFGTIYPEGSTMVTVPSGLLYEPEGYLKVYDLPQPEEGDIGQYFLPEPTLSEIKESRELFEKVTKTNTRHKEYRASNGNQKKRHSQIRSFLKNNPSKFPPCLKNIVKTIVEGGSLGFGGRAKLAYEGACCDLTEEQIAVIFSLDPDPWAYNAIEEDPYSETGVRLKPEFRESMRRGISCSHPEVVPFCDFQNCYRNELTQLGERAFGSDSPTFDEFRERASKKMEEFLND